LKIISNSSADKVPPEYSQIENPKSTEILLGSVKEDPDVKL
jgi:hypothetical protein